MRESTVEQAALAWLEATGWTIAHGPDLSPGGVAPERDDYRSTVLEERLRTAISRLNRGLPSDAQRQILRSVLEPQGAGLIERNRSAHLMLAHGIDIEYRSAHGDVRGGHATVVDAHNVEANDWLAVAQMSVQEGGHVRRPDIVLFVNGLPLALIELKSAGSDATIWTAHSQLQTYKAQIPSLFVHNQILLVSDGVHARVGTLTAGPEWFKPWRTIEGGTLAEEHVPELQVALEGAFDPRRFLALVTGFVVYEHAPTGPPAKKLAGYHQFHAVQVAVAETVRAPGGVDPPDIAAEEPGRYMAQAQTSGDVGDRRVGVVWHTQGSGKSLTMAFYAGRVIAEPSMGNPTLVILTDRNDLDDQLFATFAGCRDLLRQAPEQARSRAHLRSLLEVASGGVVFTTIQKFLPDEVGDAHPLLTDRRNVVVIADEAHRSQYDFIDGFARHLRDALPRASFVGFTGTPIETTDVNTRAVFGDYLSVYDIQRAVDDGATVPIYYESRLAKLGLDPVAEGTLDADFDEVTEAEEEAAREDLKTRWAQIERIVGSEERVRLVAADLVAHFEARQEALRGKGMVVCMSRKIAVALYQAIADLRPEWHRPDDDAGRMKVIITGSAADPPEWQVHVRSKGARETLATRFRRSEDHFDLAIVRDMWLTGFDAPSLHTMYVDKPMRGHGLMQAIARVNRVFRDKPGGLVVDYLGLAPQLQAALKTYSLSGGTGRTAIDQAEAVRVLQEVHEVCTTMFHGFDHTAWADGGPAERLGVLPAAQEHILSLDDGKDRLVQQVGRLTKAFALAVPDDRALAVRDDVAFFQAVGSVLRKRSPGRARRVGELEGALQQLVSSAISADGVVDIFQAAGLDKPDVSILSDEFLAEVRSMPQQNLAVDLLERLLDEEIRTRRDHNVVQARSFAEMLSASLRRYHNRAIEAAQVLEELIALAKDMREAARRGEELGLTDDELAFYDALETNDSAVSLLGDESLRVIAQQLVAAVRASVTIDWTVREAVRAKIRVIVKRILRRHGYPPDLQERATKTVLEQAEALSARWAQSPV